MDDAQLAQPAQRVHGRRTRLEDGFGQLQLQRAGGQAGDFEGARNVLDEVAFEELGRRRC